MSKALIGASLLFSEPNCPTREGELVGFVGEIYNIPSPRLGMRVFVVTERREYIITKLRAKVVDGVSVPNAQVDEFVPASDVSVTWNSSSNLNNFTTAGVYEIKGERTMSPSYDNLPIYNSGGGHTISARLEVLDSSINDTINDDDKCITQKLTLSNRVGGDGNVYIRTGRGRTYDSISWEPWATLQTNINVGDTRTLNNFVDNGIYSGVWTDEYNSYAETFVMVVINDYAVAGNDKTITQFKYAYDTLAGSGIPTFTTRSLFNGVWSDWTSIKGGGGSGGSDVDIEALKTELKRLINLNKTAISDEVTRAKNAENKLTKDVEYLRDSTVVYGDKPNVDIGVVNSDGSYYSTQYSARVNKFNGGTTILLNDGYYFREVLRRNADDSVAEFITLSDRPKYYRAEDVNSIYELNIAKGNDGAFSTDELANIIAEVTLFGAGSGNYTLPIATANVLGGIKSYSTYGYVGDNPSGNEHAVNVGSDGRATVTIPVANNQNYGVVKVDDSVNSESNNPVSGKAVSEAIANIGGGGGGDMDVLLAEAEKRLMRNLYITAGAEYNDTDQIIKKTAFWGAEVDHLPKHYYLNGLGDITEEQMSFIYQYKDSMTIFIASGATQGGRFWQDIVDNRLRTLFGTNNFGRWITGKAVSNLNPFASTKIEVIKWDNKERLANINGASLAMKASGLFFQNTKLRVVDRFMPAADFNFGQAPNLEELRLWATNFNITLSQNPKISKTSIVYTIENVLKTTTKALVITLHADTYTKCIEGGEWYDDVNTALTTANAAITGGGSINIASA